MKSAMYHLPHSHPVVVVAPDHSTVELLRWAPFDFNAVGQLARSHPKLELGAVMAVI